MAIFIKILEQKVTHSMSYFIKNITKDQIIDRIWMLVIYFFVIFLSLTENVSGDIHDYLVEKLPSVTENEESIIALKNEDYWKQIELKFVGLSLFFGGIFIFFNGFYILSCFSDIFLNGSSWDYQSVFQAGSSTELLPTDSYLRCLTGIRGYPIPSHVDSFYVKLFITELEGVFNGLALNIVDYETSNNLNSNTQGILISDFFTAIEDLLLRYTNQCKEKDFDEATMRHINQLLDFFLKSLQKNK